MKTKNIKYVLYLLLIGFSSIFVSYLYYKFNRGADVLSNSKVSSVEPEVLKFSKEELQKFDGTNYELPIYIGYNGKVYDVTSGRKFYELGGNYHFLAGRDSTKELEIAGGSIIESKYPVVGVLESDLAN